MTASLADVLAATDLPAPAAAATTFEAPWQAHVFALTVALHGARLFTWPEWATSFAAQLGAGSAADGERPDGVNDGYFRAWASSLQRMLVERGVATADAVAELEAAWHAAAARTPHGQPIALDG